MISFSSTHKFPAVPTWTPRGFLTDTGKRGNKMFAYRGM